MAPARPGPVLIVEAIEGAEAARAHAAIAPVRAALAECRPGTSGVIRLRLTAAEGKVHIGVVANTSLDPRQRRCVLEQLSTVDIEGISGDASPSARPSGFTAHFRIEW